MSQFLVRFGTRGIFGEMWAKKKPRKCITYKALTNEAEGTRTLNLRIDRPIPRNRKYMIWKNLQKLQKPSYWKTYLKTADLYGLLRLGQHFRMN